MQPEPISLSAWSIADSYDYVAKSSRWGALADGEALGFYRRVLGYCSERSGVCRFFGRLPAGFKLFLAERLIAFGAPQHFVLRKQAVAACVEQAVQAGCTQLVVLGAGFDVCAVRTARAHAQVYCVEMDVPGMSSHKVSLLTAHYGELPANFTALGVNLAEVALRDALARWPAFNGARSTLVVAEGLTMYLQEAEVAALFSDIRARCTGKVGVFFTAIPRAPGEGGFWNRFRKAVLGSGGEAPAWSMKPEGMEAFLAGQGFVQRCIYTYDGLQAAFRNETEMARLKRQPGEYLVYAEAAGRE
ncbi:MAG: class I SAM-dependent methyltransferase [Rickettsiales bacterium]|nr:class I SAM-dependent methyltransferase [Rickettsiales bacterium]